MTGPCSAFSVIRSALPMLSAFADQLELPPTYITVGHGGAGFTEMANMLVAMREEGG